MTRAQVTIGQGPSSGVSADEKQIWALKEKRNQSRKDNNRFMNVRTKKIYSTISLSGQRGEREKTFIIEDP